MRPRRIRHFTLLELVLAMAIFAIVMLMVGLTLNSLQQTWRKVRSHTARLKEYQVLDRIFDSAFRNAVPFTWRDPLEKNEKTIFVGDQDKASFAYMHRVSTAQEGGIRFISFSLEDGCLLAKYRKTPITPWDSGEEGISKEVLAKDVSRISFLYAEIRKDGISWVGDWREDKNPNLPAAIQIAIEWKNGEKEVWLRRTAGAGQKEYLGLKKEITE